MAAPTLPFTLRRRWTINGIALDAQGITVNQTFIRRLVDERRAFMGTDGIVSADCLDLLRRPVVFADLLPFTHRV